MTTIDPAEVVLRLQVLDSLYRMQRDAVGFLVNDLYSEALAAFKRDYPGYFEARPKTLLGTGPMPVDTRFPS